MYVLLAVLALIILILFMPLRLEVEYIYSLAESKNIFTIRLLGIKVFSSDKKRRPPESINENQKKDKENSIIKKISDIKDTYVALEKDIRDAFNFVLKILHCKKLVFHIYEGFDDAAVTGFVSGCVYGVVYGVAGILDEHVGIDELDIQVNPSFNAKRFDIYTKSIIRVTLVHSISVVLKLIRAFYKMKNINKNPKETESEIPVI